MRSTTIRSSSIAGIVVAVCVMTYPNVAAAQTSAATFDGKPEFKEGKALGYFIWRDGETWKIRWTTFGAAHKFTGRVVAEGGEISSFKRIDVDTERKVIRPGHAGQVVRGPRGRVVGVRPGQRAVVAEKTMDKIEQQSETIVQWLTNTDDDLDGVDIKVTSSTTALRFNLMIDEKARPEEVEVGKNNVKPGVNPIRVLIKQ
jgi:hypothetical protein